MIQRSPDLPTHEIDRRRRLRNHDALVHAGQVVVSAVGRREHRRGGHLASNSLPPPLWIEQVTADHKSYDWDKEIKGHLEFRPQECAFCDDGDIACPNRPSESGEAAN